MKNIILAVAAMIAVSSSGYAGASALGGLGAEAAVSGVPVAPPPAPSGAAMAGKQACKGIIRVGSFVVDNNNYVGQVLGFSDENTVSYKSRSAVYSAKLDELRVEVPEINGIKARDLIIDPDDHIGAAIHVFEDGRVQFAFASALHVTTAAYGEVTDFRGFSSGRLVTDPGNNIGKVLHVFQNGRVQYQVGFTPYVLASGDLALNAVWYDKNGLTEEQFNSVIDRLEEIFTPVIREKQGELRIIRAWKTSQDMAAAVHFGNVYRLTLYGAMARSPIITEDGYALIVCHELGHLIGGFPKFMKGQMSDNLSNEGQSDYWAALKCFRKFVEKDDNIAIMAAKPVDPYAKEQCERTYQGRDTETAVCKRSVMAGMSTLYSLADSNFDRFPGLLTPDSYITPATVDTHPNLQCRLDTYFAGALCDKSWNEEVSDTDHTSGTCNGGTYLEGSRPACWFR
ncbi:MAG: hypothetical protein NTY45_10710 [Elusimicrobia bacterium]|nr:hypothetical protein [Elusimicrobiota bacterium]